jgi:hypothetical protein
LKTKLIRLSQIVIIMIMSTLYCIPLLVFSALQNNQETVQVIYFLILYC